MSNDSRTDDADEFLDEDVDEEASAQLRWEKGVEFALARELQTWHVLNESRAAIKNWERPPELTTGALIQKVAQFCRQPRYLPMAGNAEKTLGDALAGVAIDRLLLVECKGLINDDSWKQEAEPEVRQQIGNGQEKVINSGGKDRHATLNDVRGKIWRFGLESRDMESLGQECHVLIAKSDAAEANQEASDLVFTSYWTFIFRPEKNPIETSPIVRLHHKGLALEKFRCYVYTLLEQDIKTGEGDAAWIAREMILLAHAGSSESSEGGWIGGRISVCDLAKVLELDKHLSLIHI